MAKYNFTRELICPYCGLGKVLADGKGKISISVQCPKCHRFFIGSLDTLKTECGEAQKRQGRKF